MSLADWFPKSVHRIGTPRGCWLEMQGKVCADLGEAGEAEFATNYPYRGISRKNPPHQLHQMGARW
jgi:hypothetical protein